MRTRVVRQYDDAYLEEVAQRVLVQCPEKQKRRTIYEAVLTPQIEAVVKSLIERGYNKREVAKALVDAGMDQGKWEIEKALKPYFERTPQKAQRRGASGDKPKPQPGATQPKPAATPRPPRTQPKVTSPQHGGLRTNV